MSIVFGIAIILLFIALMVLHTIYKEDIWDVKNYVHTKVYNKDEVDALINIMKEEIFLEIKKKYIEKNSENKSIKENSNGKVESR